MIEPNDISHFSFPLTHNARGYKPTTSLHSTPKSRDADVITTRVAFAQQVHAIMNSAASFYQFVGHGEAAAIVPASSHAVAAAAIHGDAS